MTIRDMKYKTGDKVKIKGLDWYYRNSDCVGNVKCGDFDFTTLQTSYCGKTLEILSVCDDFYMMKSVGHHWTDEMIECLVDEPQDKMVSLDKAVDEFRHFIIDYFPNLFPTGEEVKYITDLFRKRLEE